VTGHVFDPVASPAGRMVGFEGFRLVYFEFTQVGGSVKVTAVDPRTMTEVSIVGGPRYSQAFLTRQVVKKLAKCFAEFSGGTSEGLATVIMKVEDCLLVRRCGRGY
jgi:hypothetical protein